MKKGCGKTFKENNKAVECGEDRGYFGLEGEFIKSGIYLCRECEKK